MSNVVPISKRNIALGRRFGPPSSPRSFPNVWSTVDDVGGSQAVSGPSSIQHIDARGPVADRIVLEFAQAHMFSPGEVTLRGDRVCRVNPQLARNVVGLPSVKTSDRQQRHRIIEGHPIHVIKGFRGRVRVGPIDPPASAEQLPATHRSGL